jgi:ubiquinone biosynthesis protein
MTMNNSFKRAGHVVNVLFKHGLGYFVHEFGLKWHLPFFQRVSPKGKPPSDLPVRLRKAMEELGGAYLKLGQFLSLRPDLLPKEYCEEFKKLLDKVPPMQFSKVQTVIEQNLRGNPKIFFSHIEAQPIGSASIAQVHRAKLKNGRNVVVKVQRPEAREQFAADINIMYYIARKIERRLSGLAVSPVTIVKEFERYTAQELNFVIEARYIDQFYQHFKKSGKVVIPQVHWSSTTSQVLTMDCLEGKKLTDVLSEATKAQRRQLARNIADAAFDQVLKLGLFHADLHPGNIIVLPGNKIGLLDFGIVGNLDEALVKQAVALYAGIVEKDAPAITKVLLSAGTVEQGADIDDFKKDIEGIINGWYGTELGKARVTQMMQLLFESAVSHKIRMPVGFILLGKALVTVEGTCLALDPEFNFVEYSQPKVMRLLKEHKRPKMLLKRFGRLSKEYAELIAGIPQQAEAVMERIKRGSIELNLKETDIKHLGMDLNRSSNRLSYAMLIAALLITAAMLVDVPPKIGTYSIFAIISTVFAAFLLMALVVSVWREGNPPFDTHQDVGGMQYGKKP